MRAEQLLVHEFMQERPVMADNNANYHRMAELLQQEVDELKVEIEAGDITKIAQELPDVVWFALTIANILGIDMEDALWAKAIRNQEKYPAHYFDNGMSYEAAATLCRALWNRDNDNNYLPEKI